MVTRGGRPSFRTTLDGRTVKKGSVAELCVFLSSGMQPERGNPRPRVPIRLNSSLTLNVCRSYDVVFGAASRRVPAGQSLGLRKGLRTAGTDMKTAPILHEPIGIAPQGVALRWRSGPRSAKVFLAGRLTALAIPAETQMTALARALPEVGVAARLWRPWEDSLAEADCLHLFGAADEFLPLVEAARQYQVKVVLSPLSWLEESQRPSEPGLSSRGRTLARKVTAWAGYVGRSIYPRWPSRQRRLYQSVDLLLPNFNAEAQQIIRQFQIPADRMHVVPHGADLRFAMAAPEPFVERFGIRDFVLYAGPIEPRNHQLGFLWAMREEDLPVVILGDAVPGCQWYEAECRRVAGTRVQFVPQIAHEDPLLASSYAACTCLVVAGGSGAPQQIALEAGMSGTPLVLFENGSVSEYFGHQAVYVKPDDVQGIRRGVVTAIARKRSESLAEHVRTYFSWNAAAKATREAYAKVLRQRQR